MIEPRTARRAAVLVAFVLALGTAPAFSEAPPPEGRSWNPSCYTLKRAGQNIVWGPADMVMSPFVAGKSVVNGLIDVDDTLPVRIAYPLPGFLWNTMVQFGAGTIRGLTGVLELVPGIILCPFEAELDPLFDPAEENDALVDWENGYFDVKFGVNYTGAG